MNTARHRWRSRSSPWRSRVGAAATGCGTRRSRPHRATAAADAASRAATTRQGRAQAALLPQPDGPARHLAGAEEGPDGHGLHRRSTKARTTPTPAAARSRSAPTRCRSSACAPKPAAMRDAGQGRARRRPRRGRRAARLYRSRPSSRARSSGCTSTPPASRSAKGQPLFEVYSPELVSAQREYAIAAQGVQALKDAGGEAQAGMQQLAESSLARLQATGTSPTSRSKRAGASPARRSAR